MFKSLISCAVLVKIIGVVSAKSGADFAPVVSVVKDVKDFGGQDPWAYAEFGIGVLIGTYGSVIIQSYNHNCFGELFNFSMGTFMRQNKYFDTGIKNTDLWYGYPLFVFEMGGTFLSLLNVGGQCIDELETSKKLKWYTHYPFHNNQDADDTHTETVQFDGDFQEYLSEEEIQALQADLLIDLLNDWLAFTKASWFVITVDIASAIYSVYSIYRTFKDTSFYFLYDGMEIGSLFVDSFFLANSYLLIVEVEQIPQWYRFAGQILLPVE